MFYGYNCGMNGTQTIPYRQVLAGNTTTKMVLGRRVYVGDIRNLWANVLASTVGCVVVAVFIGVD